MIIAILLLIHFMGIDMLKNIDYTELGATLFVPAVHKNLDSIVSGNKYPNLKSVLIDTEDGITEKELPQAMQNIKELLQNAKKNSCLVFIRPRNIDVLRELLTCQNIDGVDGFIIPKFSLLNADEYLSLLKETQHSFMPSIEGEELFCQSKLFELREVLTEHIERVILVRFGLEDMLRQLKMRRKCDESIFDMSATSHVIGNFIATFKSAGFAVSGGVYPCYKESDGFKKDVQRDLKEGLFSKTIIHPSQIDLANESYRVTQKDFDEALEISSNESACFAQDGKMAEVVTMNPWAEEIIKRAEVYGVY